MNLKNIVSVVAVLGMATAALAGEEMRTKLSIAVVGDDGDDGIHIEFDDLGLDFHQMQVGENRSIIDKSGRSILVTREEDGIRFDIDGRTITMPILHQDSHSFMWIDGDGAENVDIDVMHHRKFLMNHDNFVMDHGTFGSLHSMDGTMIISDEPIDAATRQAIKSLLESAGHGSEVRFIGGERLEGGPHKVRMMKRVIEISE
ncbi:MAG: hypothetical protein IIA07_13940 [Proteobacteria bacterium]|nr:hypothetical protein [Pseudomonadota bacterium]